MSNILLINEEEASGKINIDDLYDTNMRRDLRQVTLFNKMLNRLHKRINTISRTRRNDKHAWFTVPEFLFGEPMYNQSDCIAYLVSKMVDNGFRVQYIHPHSLFISWEHWIPAYVRNEIKKKTGKIINEKGQIVGDTNTEEINVDDPNAQLLQANTNTNGETIINGKKYTPIDKYKPAGMVYNPEIFEKLEKKITFS